MAIQNLRGSQGFVQSARKSGQNDDQILERLLGGSGLDPRAKQVFQQQKLKGIDSPTLLNQFLETSPEPLITEEDQEIKGTFGTVSRFVGAEKLGRRIAAEISNLTDRDTANALKQAADSGYISQDDLKRIQTGGVSNLQALGSAALLAATAFMPGAAKGASLLAKTAKLAGTGAVFGGAGALEQTGKLEDIPRGAAIGAVVAPLGAPAITGVGMLGRFLFKTLPKSVVGALSGKGVRTLEMAVERSEAAKAGTKLLTEQESSLIAKESRNAWFGLEKKVGDNYGKALEQVESLYRRTNLKMKQGLGAVFQSNKTGQTIPLSLQGVKAKLTKVLGEFDVVVNPKTLKLDAANSVIREQEVKNVQQVLNTVNSWLDFSPTGLNRLATKISRFRRTGADAQQVNAIITATKNAVRGYIGDRIPEIQALNQEFFRRSQFLDDVANALAIGDKLEGQTGIMKTFGKIATLFDKNKDVARGVVMEFEKEAGVDVLGREAGRRLATPTSGQSASFGGLFNTVMQTIFDPITKNIPLAAGAIQNARNLVAKNVNRLPPEAVSSLNKIIDEAAKLAQQTKRIAGFDITKELSQK